MPLELFEKFIKEQGLDIKPIKAKHVTKTAKEAADAYGVPVSNIVKSLVVKIDKEFFLILCPGDKKINLQQLQMALRKRESRMATADEVKEATGHSVGGVPPFGHKHPMKTIILEGFNLNEPLWAAAGRPDTNFEIMLAQLKDILEQNNLLFKLAV